MAPLGYDLFIWSFSIVEVFVVVIDCHVLVLVFETNMDFVSFLFFFSCILFCVH